MKSEIGLIGLGVMGTSLARNIARNKYSISLYNRYVKGSEEAVAKKKIEQYRELESAKGFEDIEAFVDSLQQPRKIILMLTAGVAVDELIDQLVPHMDQGDLIIDAGNSHYRDSQRRYDQLEHKGFHFIGLGVSGGEEGALKGPSLMPGGSKEAYDLVEGLFCSIAAKTKDNKATSAYVGSGGAGHFVKMVHNGIEYAEMQLIAEFFQIMKLALEMDHQQIASVFEQWNQGDLKSYLLEITIDILRAKDQEGYLLDRIQDKAAHKGTGAWSLVAAAELGQSATMIASALFSRYTSSKKRYRAKLSQLYSNPSKKVDLSVADLKATYRFARIVNHHQGFSLIHVASKKNHWEIDLGVVCKLWTEGCIIKSDLLDQLYEVLNQNLLPLSDSSIAEQINSDRSRIEQLLSRLISTAVPVFSISNAYEFFKQLTQEQSGANLIQAQRDYFGAHGVQLLGDDSDELHHLNWNN
jgi:6-phosphogluconate dehydrogenase